MSLIVTAGDIVTVKPSHFIGVDGAFDGGDVCLVHFAVLIQNGGQRQLLLAKAAELHNADSGINAFADQRIDQCHLCLLGDFPAGAEIAGSLFLRTGSGMVFPFVVVVAVRAPPALCDLALNNACRTAFLTLPATEDKAFPLDIIAAAFRADAFGFFVRAERSAAADSAAAVNRFIHAVGIVGDQHDIDLRFYGSRTAAGNLQGHFPFIDGRLYRGFGQSHIVRRVDDGIRRQSGLRCVSSCQHTAGDQGDHQQNGQQTGSKPF